MKKKSLISLILALVMIATMCVCPISASAATVENTTTETVGTEDGWSYVEFTDPESYSARNSRTDNIGALPGEWGPGNSIKAEGNYVSVAARGENLGITVSIQMKKKTIGNLYAPVTSIATLQCDGKSHTVFNSFEVEEGATYRFFYKANTTADDTVAVLLVANFWNG